MEPLDPAKNEESSGSSKRRISSILKAPRKSIRVPDQEQRENVVECAKPAEKRNSRRVSFAPANDVLLFSKDAKNASPSPSPLQELITTTAAATQNRVQLAVTEDEMQQIAGMETLLSAPLHASQQREKVNLNTGDAFGERTVMFSTDDAAMDMTHSHTLNIAHDEDLFGDKSLQSYEVLPTSRDKTVVFSADDGSMDMTLSHTVKITSESLSLPTSRGMDLRAEKSNISSSLPPLDPEFESFLATLFKPSGSSGTTPPAGTSSEETSGSVAQMKTQRVDVDKENQVPAPVFAAVTEKSLNTSRKIGESSHGRALSPLDDVSMDMTAEKNKQQQSSKTQASFNPRDLSSMKNPPPHASHQRHKVSLETKEESREKTIMFTAGDELMDMTQSHTINITSGLLPPPCGKTDNASSSGFKNCLESLSKTGAPSGNPVTARMVPPSAAASKETVNTNGSLSQLKTDVDKENRSLNTTRSFEKSFNRGTICPKNDLPQGKFDAEDDCREKTVRFSADDAAMDVTRSHTVNIATHFDPRSHQNVDFVPACGEKTVRFSADDAAMDVTRSHTANIATHLDPQSRQNVDFGEKTVRFSADDGSMDMTLSHTVKITSGSVPLRASRSMDLSAEKRNISSTVPSMDPEFENFLASLSKPRGHSVNPVKTGRTPAAGASSGETRSSVAQMKTPRVDVDKENQAPTPVSFVMEKSQNTSRKIDESSHGRALSLKADVSMDMTEAHTGRIWGFTDEEIISHHNNKVSQTAEKNKKRQSNRTQTSFNPKDTTSLKNTPLHASHQTLKDKFDAEDDCREKTVRFSADDACMDVTRSHTVNIATHFDTQSHQNVDFLRPCGEKTVRFTADDACMDVTRSHTVNIATDIGPQSHQNVDILPACGEKTVRFSADDAAMDVTRSHTVNIATHFDPRPHRNVDILPACGEKTVRFTADDAAMDVTRSHTVNIATHFDPQSEQNVGVLPACGEKTVRFSADDAAMDVTRSHTVNIATHFDPRPHQNVEILPACGEKTVRFSADDAAMDVTRSHTVNIATDIDLQSHQNVDVLPACGEKTVRFTANDAGMDLTQSHTVNIATDSVLPHRDSNVSSSHENDFPSSVKKRESETCRPRRNRSSSSLTLDPGFKNSLSVTGASWANPVITKAALAAKSPQETADTNGLLDQIKTQKPDVNTEKEAPGFVSAVMENPVNKTMTDCPEDDVSMDMTEAQTGHILGQTCTDEPPHCLSSTQNLYPNSNHFNKTEITSQQSDGALGSSEPDGVEIPNRPDSLETDEKKEPEPRSQTCSPSAGDHDVDAVPSQNSRQRSLANLCSKIRRLSHMISTAPDTVDMDSCVAPLSQLEHGMDKNSQDKTKAQPAMNPEIEMGEENTQAQCLMEGDLPSPTTTTPYNLKTKQLMSRLSMGGFKPKLPQRSKPDEPKKVDSGGEHTRTINVTNQLGNFDGDVSDIFDEELGSCEDMSEMLDSRSLQKATEKAGPCEEFYTDAPLEDDVFEQDFIPAVHGRKRPLPEDEIHMENEKRIKASPKMATDFDTSHVVESEENITAAPCMTTHTTDYANSSHTASTRCEATFESTFKQSLFESQLEDYATDMQRKFDDGTVTVSEFFKLFNIDFVIHNPRQSVLPGRLLSDTDRTPMDLLKDRHINRPKQMVYETNVQNLTEKVEGLKERMQDLNKPLRIVNRPLWEEVRNSSEKELKSFGAKLKERNNFFRKMSKAQSHEMKGVLYSDLVQANLEEQQRFRGTIEEADQMIKSLDDCICELETELTAVEEKGYEDRPSLKSRQEEMQKVTEALADTDRQISELEMQKKQNSNKLNRLRAETRNLESHITALHTVNEWRFGEKRDDSTTYTFLHETFHLQLVYEKPSGNDADNQPERKISHITFKLQLDDEKSGGHACLVHQLLRQYIDGEAAWLEKYPTSRHVPKLLHDVGLVVSRCRLLGEELRLLKMWGGLRLDILNISCVDTQVHIVFSSLKKFSKFEVIFSVSLTDHIYVLQVQSFKNMIGSTTIQQIEEIVASFSPAKNLLTKICKKIHENLLC